MRAADVFGLVGGIFAAAWGDGCFGVVERRRGVVALSASAALGAEESAAGDVAVDAGVGAWLEFCRIPLEPIEKRTPPKRRNKCDGVAAAHHRFP